MCQNKQNEITNKSADVKKKGLQKALPQLIAVSIKNVLLLGYGMTLGFPTIVIPSLKVGDPNDSLSPTKEQISWISSINLICVPLGCIFSGILTQPIGRKKSMQILNLPFIGAWLLFHFSTKLEHIYLALGLTGLGGGLLEAPVITYVAEITQPYLRGMLSATSSMTIIFGIIIQFLLGSFYHWRIVALFNLVVPVIAIILLFLVPESPHWLIMKNRMTEARKSLAWLRGWTTMDQIDTEYKELCRALGKIPDTTTNGIDNPAFEDTQLTASKLTESTSRLDNLKKFTSRSFVLPYILICFCFFLGHFSGMTTLQTYAVQIFFTLKAPIDKYYATLVMGIVELLATLVCVVAIHYTGKRPLAFVSTIGSGLCYFIVAVYAHLIDVRNLSFEYNAVPINISDANELSNLTLPSNLTNGNQTSLNIDFQSLQWLPMTALIGSAFLSHLCIRLLPWVLIGEVYPSEIRGIASGLSGGTGYIFGFAANKLFIGMVSSLTLPGTFGLYSSISLISTIVLYFVLPETEGRSLIDIELHFSGVKKIKKHDGVYRKKRVQNVENGEVNPGFVDSKTEVNTENVDSKL